MKSKVKTALLMPARLINQLAHAAMKIASLSKEANHQRYVVSEAFDACKGAKGAWAFSTEEHDTCNTSHIAIQVGQLRKYGLEYMPEYDTPENKGLPSDIKLSPKNYSSYSIYTTCPLCRLAALEMLKYIALRKSIAVYKGQVHRVGKELLKNGNR